MSRRTLLAVSAALAAAAVILAVSGGFRTTVGGLRISARSPVPVAIMSLVVGAAWAFVARRERGVAADLEWGWHSFQRHSKYVIAIALASVIVASTFATRSAAGADASGYISESAMLISGRLSYADEFADLARGGDPYLTSPLGWRPAADGRQSPTYPPGLPLLMAIPHAIAGVSGAAAVVIVSAGVAVIATALLASELGGSVAGVIAAVLLAFSPIFIHQSIQPMSDVPVTAAWMMCFLFVYRRRSLAAGLACALAVLIRPNLAPLAIVPLLISQSRLAFAVPVAIAGIYLAVMQWVWYGSPWRSGYGPVEELFALANIAPNATHYFNWLITTAPILLVSIFGFVRLKRDRMPQALLAFAILVIGSYLVYAVFDDWSYLRFLLPALAVMAMFAAIELAAWLERWPIPIRVPLFFTLILGLTAYGLWTARSRETFKLADQLRRVSQVADFINDDVPPAAVILSGEQSGSMRYYTERPILRWEAATPGALSAAMTTLEKSRRPIYIVLDAWEQPLFRAKFGSLPAGALDWPPILDAGTSHRTQLWKLSDRDRFVRGENLSTIRLP